MLELQRIPANRQRVVGTAVEKALAEPPHKVPAPVIEAGKAVVKSTHALAPSSGPSLPDVDRATDKVVAAVGKILDGYASLAVDDLIEPAADVRALAQAGAAVQDALLPNGTGFVTARSNIEWNALSDLIKSAESPEAAAGLKALHLAPALAHLRKHVELYAHALGIGAAPGEAAQAGAGGTASDAWHTAFTQFAIEVSAHVKDPATRTALLGAYETQLEAHQSEMRSTRKARAKSARDAGGTKPGA